MEINAYAKINIGLDVIRRRPDGYHEVRMIMQQIGLHDVLYIDREDVPGIRIRTGKEELSSGEDNLIYKAAKLLMDEYNLSGGVRVDLQKNIPIAAGLAGGSTDAAATLIAINRLYDLGLSQEELMKLGVRIGADVPFCIMGGCAMAEGIGEILTPIESHVNFKVLLAKPSESVSTKYVYEHLNFSHMVHPDIDAIADGLAGGDVGKVVRNMGNVLETVTASEVSAIGNIERIMTGCPGNLKAMMSGSGPTVYGLFDHNCPEDEINGAYGSVEASGYARELYMTDFYYP